MRQERGRWSRLAPTLVFIESGTDDLVAAVDRVRDHICAPRVPRLSYRLFDLRCSTVLFVCMGANGIEVERAFRDREASHIAGHSPRRRLERGSMRGVKYGSWGPQNRKKNSISEPNPFDGRCASNTGGPSRPLPARGGERTCRTARRWSQSSAMRRRGTPQVWSPPTGRKPRPCATPDPPGISLASNAGPPPRHPSSPPDDDAPRKAQPERPRRWVRGSRPWAPPGAGVRGASSCPEFWASSRTGWSQSNFGTPPPRGITFGQNPPILRDVDEASRSSQESRPLVRSLRSYIRPSATSMA